MIARTRAHRPCARARAAAALWIGLPLHSVSHVVLNKAARRACSAVGPPALRASSIKPSTTHTHARAHARAHAQALSELHRVLRPGSAVAILDFNNSANPVVDAAQARACACTSGSRLFPAFRARRLRCGVFARPEATRGSEGCGSYASLEPHVHQSIQSNTIRSNATHIQSNPIQRTQAFALAQLVVPAARRLGVADEYEYLRPSIQAFPRGA